MSLQHAYAVTNKAGSLAAAAFNWSNSATTNRAYLNDGRLDRQFNAGAVLTTLNVVIDFGADVTLTAIAILNHNLATATGATLKVEAADNAGISSGSVTPKAITTLNTTAPRQKDHVLQFASTTKRYWRITFAWTGTFTLLLGEIYAAQTSALTRAVVYGSGKGLEYIRSRFRSDTGETRGHFIAGPIRTRQMPFDDLSDSERAELEAMFIATRGGVNALLWCEQYEATATAADNDHQECILGRLEDATWGFTEIDFGRFNPDGMLLRSLGREVGS